MDYPVVDTTEMSGRTGMKTPISARALLTPEPLVRAWSRLRELGKDALTLRAIEQLIDLERLRGSRGA